MRRAWDGVNRAIRSLHLDAELCVLVTAGTGLALVIAGVVSRVLPALTLPGGIDLGRLNLRPDWRVLVFGLLAATLVMLGAAVPALRRTLQPRIAAELVSRGAGGAPASFRLREIVLAVHVAAAVLVLVAAGAFTQAVYRGFSTGPGFDVSQTVFAYAMITPQTGISSQQMSFDESARR